MSFFDDDRSLFGTDLSQLIAFDAGAIDRGALSITWLRFGIEQGFPLRVSGTVEDLRIVPEPNTAILLSLGLVLLSGSGGVSRR